jgi:CheY-specific phosphatase CheX
MNPELEPALRQAALTTFGDMCMALPSVEISMDQIEAPFEAEVRVGFHGPVKGEVCVRLYGTVLDALAQGMIGEGELMEADLLRDALGEIGNVICGNTLPLISDERTIFRLDPPRAALAKDPPLTGPSVTKKTQVGLDGGRAEVGIFLEVAA